MKTEVLSADTEAVWIPQSRECEFLVLMRTGEVIGHIHQREGLWNGYWFRASARRAEEAKWDPNFDGIVWKLRFPDSPHNKKD